MSGFDDTAGLRTSTLKRKVRNSSIGILQGRPHIGGALRGFRTVFNVPAKHGLCKYFGERGLPTPCNGRIARQVAYKVEDRNEPHSVTYCTVEELEEYVNTNPPDKEFWEEKALLFAKALQGTDKNPGYKDITLVVWTRKYVKYQS